jgi:hypothetical protein
MEDTLISSLLKNINTITYQSFIENNISYYESKDDFFKDIYFKLLKELKKEYIKIIKMAPEKLCLSILCSGPRKGEKCGVKTKDGSNYCKKHKAKEEGPRILQESEELEDSTNSSYRSFSECIDQSESPHSIDVHSNNTTRYIIKKNMFDNFVFGNTPYIFKSATEKYIVARQGLNGEWIPLSEEDKQICRKKYHLRCRDLDHSEKPSVDISFVQENIKLPYETNPYETPSIPLETNARLKKGKIKAQLEDVEQEYTEEVVLNVKKKVSNLSQQKQVAKKEKVKVQDDDQEDSDDVPDVLQEVVLNVKKKVSNSQRHKQVSKKEKVKVNIDDDE